MTELIKKEGNNIEFKIEIGVEEVTKAYENVFKSLAKNVRIAGFRAGKAPRNILKARVGEDYINSEVLNQLLNAHLFKSTQELDLQLVDFELVSKNIKDKEAFTLHIKGENYPEISLGDWKNIELKNDVLEISEEVFEQTLKDIQERAATFEEVERAAESGDQVIIEEDDDTYPIYLDIASEEIKEAIIGKNKDEEFEFKQKDATIKAKIKTIKSKQLPELNDEFAKTMQFETLEKLKEVLKEELNNKAKREARAAKRDGFVNSLVEGMTVDIPESLIKRHENALLSEIKGNLGRQNVKWSEYESFMKEQDKLEEFNNQLKESAVQRVKHDLALSQLSRDLKIEVSYAEISQELFTIAQRSGMTIEEVQRRMGSNGINALYADISHSKAIDEAIKQIEGNLTNENKETSTENTNKQ